MIKKEIGNETEMRERQHGLRFSQTKLSQRQLSSQNRVFSFSGPSSFLLSFFHFQVFFFFLPLILLLLPLIYFCFGNCSRKVLNCVINAIILFFFLVIDYKMYSSDNCMCLFFFFV